MGFDNRNFDRGRGGDNRRFDRPQMHEATCSKCGKSCMVPFRPTGNRPIYCNDCFKTEGGTSVRRSDDRGQRSFSDRGSRSTSDRQMFDAVCDNCGNRCQIPFAPRPGKKVYCSHCFEQMEKGAPGAPESPRIQEQLDAMNIKLGKILQLLSSNTDSTIQPETKKAEKPTELAPKAEVVLLDAKVEKKKPVKKKTAVKKKTPEKKA